MLTKADVQVRRVCEAAKDDGGTRVLVDQLSPRRMTKAKAAPDEWCKNNSPSTELRKCCSHGPATELTAAKAEDVSEASVLAGLLRQS